MTINYNNLIPFSKYILCTFQEQGHRINNLRLQRILYQIFKETNANAYIEYKKKTWGPCFEKVYYYYCGYGVMPIWVRNEELPSMEEYESFSFTFQDLEIISKIFNEEIAKDDLTAIFDFNKKFGF